MRNAERGSQNKNIQHPTSNIQHPMTQAKHGGVSSIGCWMFCFSPPPSLRALDPLEQELREYSFATLVEIRHAVIHVELAAAVGECGEVVLQRFVISLAHDGGVGDQI